MPQLLQSILEQVRLASVLDIAITAVLLYWLFSLIRGTSAVRLVIGVSVLFAVYFAARILSLRLLTQILETGAVVGLFALVVIFQPELRRALDRIGRVGSLGWLVSAESRQAEFVATEVARAAGVLSAEGHGALMVIERETGLEQIAETGVMIHGDLSADLLRTIFSPRSPLHDGAVVIRGSRILAAGTVLPLGETTMHSERFGTRHRAALGTTEQTDAVVVVVSEENGQMSLVERARIRRNLNEAQLARALRTTLEPPADRGRLRLAAAANGTGATRFAELRQAVRRDRAAIPEPIPPEELMTAAGEPVDPEGHAPPAEESRVPGDPGTSPPDSPQGTSALTDDRERAAREPAGTRGRTG
jgi:diadenylate cyclase